MAKNDLILRNIESPPMTSFFLPGSESREKTSDHPPLKDSPQNPWSRGWSRQNPRLSRIQPHFRLINRIAKRVPITGSPLVSLSFTPFFIQDVFCAMQVTT